MNRRARLAERLAEAEARAGALGRPAFFTLAVPAADGADPLAAAVGSQAPFAFWEQPSRRFSFAALGSAHSLLVSGGADRFAAMSNALRELRARTLHQAWDGADRAPLLIGGFSFDGDSGWPGFPAGRLTLPELALIRRPSGAAWVAATPVRRGDDPHRLADSLIERLERAAARPPPPLRPAAPDHRAAAQADLSDPVFRETARAAVAEVAAGSLSKVVPARRLTLEKRPDPGPFLAALRQHFTECAIFAFAAPEGVFCGATPELLARVEGVSVSAAALAGTARRGADAAQDEAIARRLRRDPKQVEEHDYVHSEIRRRLQQGGLAVDPPAPTEVMRLPGLQHLRTPVTAAAPVGTNVLDVAGALHPTPAVAGLPAGEAVEWLRAHEGFDRGWFAGPVGFCDLAGQGEFHAALRCALLRRTGCDLFAGAGVVAASVPEQELAETELKLGALLPWALGA